jgi:protein SCO1
MGPDRVKRAERGMRRGVLKALLGVGLWAAVFLFSPGVLAHVERAGPAEGPGIDPHLGSFIPLDATFMDEEGRPVTLGQLIHQPAIMALVYLHCKNVCSILLENLAVALDRLPAEPGKDYLALAVSFDENETAAVARENKEMYVKMIARPFPAGGWRFLTGDRENIRRLTDAAGFHFRRVGMDFEHPVTLLILSPEGKIIRYLYGIDISPLELKMSLVEASEGRIGPAVAQVLRFCFSYDPRSKKMVFNVLRVTGVATLFLAAGILFLALRRRKPPVEGE